MSIRFSMGSLLCSLLLLTASSGHVEELLEEGDDLDVEQRALGFEKIKDREYNRDVFEKEFVGAGDDIVRYKEYKRKGHVKAYVIFLNGRTEFIEKYDPLFTSHYEMTWETSREQTLADLPITFYAIDHAGQGESEGMRSHIDNYDTFTDNVLGLINQEKNLRKHKKPIYIMGRSMGGLIATRFAEQYPEYVDGLILTSPMLGINAPEGVSVEQLQQLVAGYTLGFGLGNRCARAVDPMVLGAIATCLTDKTNKCQPCFLGNAENCGDQMPWDAMRASWELLNSERAITCEDFTKRNAKYSCTYPGAGFNGTTSNYDYCSWMESHHLAGPEMTLGWMHASFEAIGKAFAPENLEKIRDIPTLVLSSAMDFIVDTSSHGEFCSEMENCELVVFESNLETGPVYFHEMLAEVDRASVLDEIRDFLRHPRFKGRKCHGEHGCHGRRCYK